MSTNLKSLFAAYTVRNVKTFIGMEGPGFNATLCRDGRPIASVRDEAVGDTFQFDWKSDPEEIVLRTLCAKVPPQDYHGMSIAYNMDQLVSRLLDDYDNEKRLKRLARKKTLFRIKGDLPDDWRSLSIVGPKAMQYLATKYSDQLETIYGQGGVGRDGEG